jgi:hypothetical protein
MYHQTEGSGKWAIYVKYRQIISQFLTYWTVLVVCSLANAVTLLLPDIDFLLEDMARVS